MKWCSCIEWEDMRDKHWRVIMFLSSFFPPVSDGIDTEYDDCPYCGSELEFV